MKNTTINIDDVFCMQLINFLFAISHQIVDTLSCQYLTSISFFIFSFFFWFGIMASQVAWWVKNLPAMQETQVQSLGWEDPLEDGMTTHSGILAWRVPWTEEPGRLWAIRVAKSQTRLKQVSMHACIPLELKKHKNNPAGPKSSALFRFAEPLFRAQREGCWVISG